MTKRPEYSFLVKSDGSIRKIGFFLRAWLALKSLWWCLKGCYCFIFGHTTRETGITDLTGEHKLWRCSVCRTWFYDDDDGIGKSQDGNITIDGLPFTDDKSSGAISHD